MTMSLVLSPQARQTVKDVEDRCHAVKHVLLSDERLPVQEVARQAGVSRTHPTRAALRDEGPVADVMGLRLA